MPPAENLRSFTSEQAAYPWQIQSKLISQLSDPLCSVPPGFVFSQPAADVLAACAREWRSGVPVSQPNLSTFQTGSRHGALRVAATLEPRAPAPHAILLRHRPWQWRTI